MRKTFNNIVSPFVIFAITTLVSCNKIDHAKSAAIDFGVQTLEMKAAIGSTIVDNDNVESKSFGVSGVVTDNEGGPSLSNVFNGDRVNVIWDGDSWEYSPEAYWRINKWYRFRAYHPYESPAITVQNASGDKLTVEYSTVAGQDDLLVGFTSIHATASNIVNRVPIEFQHALSGLRFQIAFKNVDDIDDDYTDDITLFYMTGLSPMGTMIYSHKDGNPLDEELSWLPSFYDNTEFYEWTGEKQFPKLNDEKTNARVIYETDGGRDGLVFVIPQVCSKSTDEPTMIHFKTKKGGSALHSAQLPELTWEPGKIYEYTLLVNKSDVTIQVSIKPWKELESNETLYL